MEKRHTLNRQSAGKFSSHYLNDTKDCREGLLLKMLNHLHRLGSDWKILLPSDAIICYRHWPHIK